MALLLPVSSSEVLLYTLCTLRTHAINILGKVTGMYIQHKNVLPTVLKMVDILAFVHGAFNVIHCHRCVNAE